MTHTQLLLLTLCAQSLLMAAVWGLAGWRLRVCRSASRHWAGYCLTSALAAAVLAFTGGSSVAWTSGIGNVAIVVAVALFARGLERFQRRPQHDFEYVAMVIAIVLVSLAYIAGWLPAVLRAAFAAGAAAVTAGLSVWRVGPGLVAEFGVGIARMVTWPMRLACGVFMLRALHVTFMVRDESQVGAASNTSMNMVVLGALAVLMLAFNIVLASLVVLRLVRRLDRLSLSDSLTRLPNRRMLMQRMQALHRRRVDGSGEYAVIILDLDHFKQINDVHGHATGDEALCGAAMCFARVIGQSSTLVFDRNVRERDPMLARLGGEEFCVLVPDRGPEGVLELAEALRHSLTLADVRAPDGGDVALTTSVGVAWTVPADTTFDAALRRADTALYTAKAAGRNRVVVQPDPQTVAIRAVIESVRQRANDPVPRRIRWRREAADGVTFESTLEDVVEGDSLPALPFGLSPR